jgi:ribosomal protein S6
MILLNHMNKMFYKVALLFKGDLAETEINAEYAKVLEILKTYGEILQELKPNKIGLAYPISKTREAYFATVKFAPKEETIVDFKTWFKKANILRVMVTKNDNLAVEKVTGFSPIIKPIEAVAIETLIPEIATLGIMSEETLPIVEPTIVENEPIVKEEKPEIDMNALDEKLEELLKE